MEKAVDKTVDSVSVYARACAAQKLVLVQRTVFVCCHRDTRQICLNLSGYFCGQAPGLRRRGKMDATEAIGFDVLLYKCNLVCQLKGQLAVNEQRLDGFVVMNDLRMSEVHVTFHAQQLRGDGVVVACSVHDVRKDYAGRTCSLF